VRPAWPIRVSCFHPPGLVWIFIVASLLTSLMPPRMAQAQSPELASTGSGPRAEMVDDVPLIPMTKEQRGECQLFADHLKRPVPCPGLLPEPIPVSPTSAAVACPGDYGALGEGSCGPAGIEVSGNLFQLSQSNFQVPPGYVGVSYEQNNGAEVPEASISGGPLGHFVFMSGVDMQQVMTNSRGKDVAPVPSYCSPLHPVRPTRADGDPGKLYRCADASNSPADIRIVEGHTLLVWKDAGITCEVSFHGHSQVNVQLDVAVADATVLVSPRIR